MSESGGELAKATDEDIKRFENRMALAEERRLKFQKALIEGDGNYMLNLVREQAERHRKDYIERGNT
jgi:hypothetical protein